MSVLKRKSSIALITGTIVVLLLIPVWYTMLAPSVIISELEKIDLTTSFEGTFGKEGYLLTAVPGVYFINRTDVSEFPITVTAHAYATEVKGENVTLRIDATMIRNDTGETLPNPFSRNSTYIFNKFTLENVKDSPDADKPREGHDPLYPLHLKAGENILNAWLDNLNTTATLQYIGSVKEGGLTLYKYFVSETVTDKLLWLPPPIDEVGGFRNCTVTSTKTILIEPLSGLLVYTENEVFSLNYTWVDWVFGERREKEIPSVYVTYKSTPEAKADGLETAKTARDGLQLLELYIPSMLGVIAIVLTVGLAFNVRRLKRKKPPSPKT